MDNASLRSHIIHHDQSELSRPNQKEKRGENDNIHNLVNINKAINDSTYPNLPRFPCAYPFLTDFRGQFWGSSGTQNGSYSISSESSRRPLSNGINFTRIGVQMRALWLPEVGVSELFLCTFPMKIPVKREVLLANREFHVVAGVDTFPTHPGSWINLSRVGKTLCAKAAVREEKRVLLPARFFSNLVPVRARF